MKSAPKGILSHKIGSPKNFLGEDTPFTDPTSSAGLDSARPRRLWHLRLVAFGASVSSPLFFFDSTTALQVLPTPQNGEWRGNVQYRECSL